MSRIMRLPKFNRYNCKLKHDKSIEWSMTCQYRDEDTEKYCDFEEHGSREFVEAAALHHLLSIRGHTIIIFKEILNYYWIEEKG